MHTSYSFDTGMFGITVTPDDPFRLATGGEVVLDNGQRFKQDRPLDWLSITDPAEYLGIADQIRAGSPALLGNPQGKRWYELSKTSPQEGVTAAIEAVLSVQTGKPVFERDKLSGAAWTRSTAAAEKWNRPGFFTTLHGFEWTSAPGGNNLHRTVIFRDGAERANQALPFCAFDSSDPGMIGGSDAHVGVVTNRADHFFGEFGNGLHSPERWKTPLASIHNDPKKASLVSVWQEQAAGLGGVWARENTREAIWDALERKDAYTTTGDRPVVRLFAGWDFGPADVGRCDFAANGHARGVPMGGNLAKAPAGNSVDVANASYSNNIDATQRAFHDVRVVQIPTPRWTAYDAAYFKVTMTPNVPMVTQERAFTSPAWYSPR